MLSLEENPPPLGEGMPLPLPPSVQDIACILYKCRQEKNLAHALRLHAYIRESGLGAHTYLGNSLILTLVEVGSMYHAQQVFDRLGHPDESSWNCLITGYVKRGELRHALTLYQKMQEDKTLHPNGYTFVALLKACSALKDLERGREIHDELARRGLLDRNVFIGSTLVNMYAKCGSLAKAQEVFDKLSVRNVVSWTALIAGYAEYGHADEALCCFELMQHEGISPDDFTLVCCLKACGSIGAIDKGCEIHAEIARQGLLESNVFISSILVDMYVKCGCLAKAQEVFDKLVVRNVVSWNALIAGYVEHGHVEEALYCLKQMQHEGISSDAFTLACSLKSCGSLGETDKGREIHAEIAKKGLLESDTFVGSALVDMYAKCGSLAEAHEVFDKLQFQTAVSWNALIAGYAEYGYNKEALHCFEQMQHEGISSDAITLLCILKACGSVGATIKGQEIHAEIGRKGLERELLVGNTLVDMYAKFGSLAEAQEVFDKLSVRTVVSWTALMAGYAQHRRGQEALYCFKQMQHEGVSLNAVAFICSLKACGAIGATDKGREIHAEIARKGLLENDLFVGSILVDMYAKCGLLAEAHGVFDKLLVRDAISWTALIIGYAEHGHGEEAINCFEQMHNEGVSPDVVTIACSLTACGSIGAIIKGQDIHAEIAKKGLETELLVGNTLVDMYAKCGSLATAQEVFDKLPVRDIFLWNALIAGYAQLGESENVFHICDRMIGEGVNPDLVTFLSVLNACSHAGLVEKGQVYFEAISNEYGFIPTIQHYTCMVDLLVRAGHIEQAVVMIKKMPFHPNIVVWHTVLGACQKWGSVELGNHAFEHALGLSEKDAAAYVCMSNIYANVAMEEDANRFETVTVEKQASM